MTQNIAINITANGQQAAGVITQVGNALGGLPQTAQQAAAQFNVATNSMTVNLRQVQTQAGQTGSQLSALDQRVTSLAASLLLYRGLREVFAVIEGGTKDIFEFQTAMIKVEALTGASAESTARYSKEIRQMALEGKTSAIELAEAQYFVSSVIHDTSDAITVMHAVTNAANAGFGDATAIAKGTTAALNDYRLSAGDAARVTNVLAAAVVEGKSQAGEFESAIGRLLPVAAELHIPIEAAASAMATLTKGGVNAAQAATAVTSLIKEIEAPSKGAQKELEHLGLTADQLRTIIQSGPNGLASALDLLIQRSNGNVEALRTLLPNIRGYLAALQLGGEGAATFAATQERVTTSTQTVERAVGITASGVVASKEKMSNAFKEIGLSIGDVVDGPLADFTQGVANSISKAEAAKPPLTEAGKAATSAGTQADASQEGWNALGKAIGFAINIDVALFRRKAEEIATIGKFIADTANNIQKDSLRSKLGPEDYKIFGLTNNPAEAGLGGGGLTNVPEGVEPGVPAPPAPPAATTGTDVQKPNVDDMVAAARATAMLSSESQKLRKTMDEVWGLPAATQIADTAAVTETKLAAMALEIGKQADAWEKALPPAEAHARINQLESAYREFGAAARADAILDSDANKQRLADARAYINTILDSGAAEDLRATKAKQAAAEQRRIDAERKREAAEAKRQSQTAASGFEIGLAKIGSLTGETDKLGDVRQTATATLTAAMEAENGPSAVTAGEAVTRSVKTLIDRMRKDRIPDFADLGTAYADAMLTALHTKTSEDAEIALDLQNQVLDAIRQAETLTSGKILNAGPTLSSGSQSLLDSVTAAKSNDTDQTERAAQDAVNRVKFQLEGLSPEYGAQLTASLMEGIAQGIDDNAPDAYEKLRAFLSEWDQQFVLAIAGDKAQKAMDKAMEDFNRQVQDMDDSLKLKNERTTDKAGLTQRHETELKKFEQDQTAGDTTTKREEEDAARERQRDFQDAEAKTKLTEQHQLLTVTAFAQLTEKQKQEHLRQMQEQDAVDKYKATLAANDLERKRKFEDKELEFKRAAEDKAHQEKKDNATELTQFKIRQQQEVEDQNLRFETEDYNRQVQKAANLANQRITDAKKEYEATHAGDDLANANRPSFAPITPDISLTPKEYAARFGSGATGGTTSATGQGVTGANGLTGATGNTPVPVEIVADRTKAKQPKEFNETGEQALHDLSARDKEALTKIANSEQGRELRERMGNGQDYLTELLRILRSGQSGVNPGGAAGFLGNASDPYAQSSVSPYAQAALNAGGNVKKTAIEMTLKSDIPSLIRLLLSNPGNVTDVTMNGEAIS